MSAETEWYKEGYDLSDDFDYPRDVCDYCCKFLCICERIQEEQEYLELIHEHQS